MMLIFFIVFLAYFFGMVALLYGTGKAHFPFSRNTIPTTTFCIIVPFRNEAENLPILIKSISLLNYPTHLFEIIFVNDASEDDFEEILLPYIKSSVFTISLIQNKRLSNSPKKDAISEAIKKSRSEWIVTTDADCEVPKTWLVTLDAFIQSKTPSLVAGPVVYRCNGSFIENFQQLDGLSLQAVTMGSFGLKCPMICNGANLAYQKSAFIEVDGFSGNDHLASGDDIFLLEKMKKTFPKKVKFLKSKEATVLTKPKTNLKEVINQRIRWASKSAKQKNIATIVLGILVFTVNMLLIAAPILMIVNPEIFLFYAAFILLKFLVDYTLVRTSADFFGIKFSLWEFCLQFFTYAFFMLLIVPGSLRGNYVWKDRRFSKQR